MAEYNALQNRLFKTITVDYADVLERSEVFNQVDRIRTSIPMLNVALSGKIGGGLTAGVSLIAGPSRHFKSAFALICAAAYLNAYPDAVLVFFDSEFGSPIKYFTSVGIDTKRVIHVPVTTLESLRTEVTNIINETKRGDHVIFVADSIGNLASNKESKDAADGKEAADFTRAKVIKSMFRIITPQLKLKNIPFIAIMHIYETMEMYAKKIISGGTGALLAADTAFIIGKQAEREDKEVVGYDFIINIDKSRFVKEKTKIPITVSFAGGIMKWSGFFDLAVTGKFLTRSGKSYYSTLAGENSQMYSRKELENNGEFWKKFLTETAFAEWIEAQYALPEGSLITEEVDAAAMVADAETIDFSEDELAAA